MVWIDRSTPEERAQAYADFNAFLNSIEFITEDGTLDKHELKDDGISDDDVEVE